MITFPETFDMSLLISDLMVICIPIVVISVAILTYKIIDCALSFIGQD